MSPFVFRNKESWKKGDIADTLVLMDYTESRFKSLQEDKLWVTNGPMKSKVLALTTVIGKHIRQLDSEGDVKQSDKPLGNPPPLISASGNNEKYNPPKHGELLTKMFGK